MLVTTASTETLNGTVLGVTFVRGETKVTPQIVPFSKL